MPDWPGFPGQIGPKRQISRQYCRGYPCHIVPNFLTRLDQIPWTDYPEFPGLNGPYFQAIFVWLLRPDQPGFQPEWPGYPGHIDPGLVVICLYSFIFQIIISNYFVCPFSALVCSPPDHTGCSAKVAPPPINFSKRQIVKNIAESQSGPPKFLRVSKT